MTNTYIEELLKLAAEKKGQKGKNQGPPVPTKFREAPMTSKMQQLLDNAQQVSTDKVNAKPTPKEPIDTSKFNTDKGGVFRKFMDKMKFRDTLKERAAQEAAWAPGANTDTSKFNVTRPPNGSRQLASNAVRESMPNTLAANGAPLVQNANIAPAPIPSAPLVDTNNLPRPQQTAVPTQPPAAAQQAVQQAMPNANNGQYPVVSRADRVPQPAPAPVAAVPTQPPVAAQQAVQQATPQPTGRRTFSVQSNQLAAPAPEYAPQMVTKSAIPDGNPESARRTLTGPRPRVFGAARDWVSKNQAERRRAALQPGWYEAVANQKEHTQPHVPVPTEPHVPVDTSKFNVTRPSKPVTGMSGRNKVLAGLGMLGTLGAGIGAGKMMSKEAAMARLLEHGYDIDTALKLIDHTENH